MRRYYSTTGLSDPDLQSTKQQPKLTSDEIYGKYIESSLVLSQVFTNPKLKEDKLVKSILIEYENVYVQYLKALFEEGKYEKIRKTFEQLGENNNLQGEPAEIYLNSLLVEKTSMVNYLSKLAEASKTPGTKEFPLNVHIPSQRAWIILYILGIIISVIFLIVYLNASKGTGLGGMLNTQYNPVDKSNTKVTFDDVKGNLEAKEDMQDLVEYLKNPERFANVKVPKGILLVGPPGTGKTLLARALAGEADVPFIVASGSEFEEVFVGLGARRIRQLFEEAKKQSPCIIFIDEIDAVAGSRDKNIFNKSAQMSLNQLLVELDGFTSREGIILIGATNMPQTLDPALVRPGRFDRKIYLGLPNAQERLEILEYYLKKHTLAEDVSPKILIRQLAGFSGADIENLVNWAAIETIKQDLPAITMHALEMAIMNVAMGREKKNMLLTDNVKKTIAYHEGGHALAAYYTEGAPEIRKATLIPRGEALGMVNYIPKEDDYLKTRAELFAHIVMAMAGTAAENMIFGNDKVTSGASSDLMSATKTAKMMVTKFGMSDKFGHVYLEDEDNYFETEPNDNVSAIVHEEVKALLEEGYDTALNLLKERETELHRLASALLKYETLEKEDIIKVLKGECLTEKELKNQTEKELSAERKKQREEREATINEQNEKKKN